MKKKTLVLLSLALFSCVFASAQTFGFASTGGALYCNYEQLSYYGAGLWAGADNLSACGMSINATISGFSAIVKKGGLPVYGAGVIYGDSIYVTLYGSLARIQLTTYTKTKCTKQGKKGQFQGGLSWMGVAAVSGFFAGANDGWVTCSVPGKKGVVATMGPSIGSARRPFIHSGGN
jgi:hypothetical protein